MTKRMLIQYLLACDVERYNCGQPGTNSYCKRQKAYERMDKAALMTLVSAYGDADFCRKRGLS